jgi:hypothetical protein
VAETQHYSPENTTRKIKEELHISETQNSTPMSQKTKRESKISPIPESMHISVKSTNVLAVDTPVKHTNNPPVSSVLSSNVKKDVIPDSMGLNTTANTSALVAETINEIMEKWKNGKNPGVPMGKNSTKTSQSDVIPESMDMVGSFVASRENRKSSQSSQEGREDTWGWKSSKRTRMSESVGELESEVIPTKRARSEIVSASPDEGFPAQGMDGDEGKRKMFKREKEDQTNGVQSSETHQSRDIEKKSDLIPLLQRENAVPDGFLSTRRPEKVREMIL